MSGYRAGSLNVETITEDHCNGFFFECKTITDIEPIRKQGLTDYCIHIGRRGFASKDGLKYESTGASVEISAMWGGWYDFDNVRDASEFLRKKLSITK